MAYSMNIKGNSMKRYIKVALGISFVAAAACVTPRSVTAQITPPVATAIPGIPAEVPFELYRGDRIFLRGKLNGHDTPMLLDSGAGVTTLDRGFARSIGIKEGQKITAQGVGGSEEAELVHGVTIEVGNLKLSNATVAVLELDLIEKAIGRPMPVILGREMFMTNAVAIDFERQVLSLTPNGNFPPPSGATEVKLKRDGTLHYLPISIDGLPPVDAALDLGNGGALSLSKEYHEAKPQLHSLPFALGMGGGVGGVHELKRTTLPKLELAGFSFSGVPTELDVLADGPYAGRANAGIEMFKPFEVTLDLGHDRMWLKRSGSAVQFDKDRAGMSLLLDGEHLNVLFVAPGSPADQTGVKKGDRLVAINGQRVDQGFYSSPLSGWARGTPGTAVELTLASGTRVRLTLRDYY